MALSSETYRRIIPATVGVAALAGVIVLVGSQLGGSVAGIAATPTPAVSASSTPSAVPSGSATPAVSATPSGASQTPGATASPATSPSATPAASGTPRADLLKKACNLTDAEIKSFYPDAVARPASTQSGIDAGTDYYQGTLRIGHTDDGRGWVLPCTKS